MELWIIKLWMYALLLSILNKTGFLEMRIINNDEGKSVYQINRLIILYKYIYI